MVKLALVNMNMDVGGGYPQLGLGHIASYLRKYSSVNKIKIFDINFEDIKKGIRKFKPDVVGISSMTYSFPKAVEFAQFIKQTSDIPTIIGGMHITALPSTLPNCFDIGVVGEGEQTMHELMQKFEKNGLPTRDQLKKINGICFHNSNKVVITKERPLIQRLDIIPPPARDLFNKKWLRKSMFLNTFGRFAHMMTSRGCPYRCTFCSIGVFWRNRVRFFSVDRIVNEINELIEKYKISYIQIYDDNFTLDTKRLMELHSRIIKEGIHQKVKFTCLARADSLDEQTVRILKEMNVDSIGLSLESGSERVLSYLKKNTTKINDNKKALHLCTKNKIFTFGHFIIGNPNETSTDLKETLKFVRDNRSKYFLPKFYITTPLPKTELWKYAIDKNLIDEDNIDFSTFSIDSLENIKNSELAELIKNRPLLIDIDLNEFYRICKEFVKVQRMCMISNPRHMLNLLLLNLMQKLETAD